MGNFTVSQLTLNLFSEKFIPMPVVQKDGGFCGQRDLPKLQPRIDFPGKSADLL